ncbi:aspartyl protease family protein [Sulfobacillus harzensis]|uniref:Aspartyl protease n=1 Tax=Sulfobacillus harzensis TaxID=2729629 RepID=A0A7Y0Q586_9FIRM|nr:hypothetical protein [Sulfobacillus harzensis]
MRLEYRDGLLFASLTIEHGGRTVTVDNVIVDTGAADTIIDIIAVEPLQLAADEDDVIVRMAGLGGFDYAVRKTVDALTFAGHTLRKPSVDFGNLVGHPGIHGLLGMDILTHGQFVLDLHAVTINPHRGLDSHRF